MAYLFQIPEIQSRSNAALVVVWPFVNKYTYNVRGKADIAWALEVEPEPLFITHIVSVSTKESKGNHLSSASINFKDIEGLDTRITPTDWMAIWLFDNIEDANRVKERIKKNASANDFRDGLKFLGRVSGVNRSVTINPNGTQTKNVTITGEGFGEFDAKVYYDPALNLTESANLHWARTANLFGKASDTARYTSGAMISLLIGVFLGGGPGAQAKGSSELPRVKNTQFIMPAVIAKVLGALSQDDDASFYTYSSLLTTYIGRQKYSRDDTFTPDIAAQVSDTHYRMGVSLSGLYGPQVQAWVGVPLWSCLQQFLNPAINEMYTCLRADPQKKIMPMFVARQIPFTSDRYKIAKNQEGYITRFSELPRWVIPTDRIARIDTTRSDATHTNFVHITNISPRAGPTELSNQRANVYPADDINDHLRCGLRSVLQTTNTFPLTTDSPTPKYGPANFWTQVAADRMMGFHLRWGGQIILKGIQEPICVGDNVQVLDIVYHIEGVSHSMNIQQDGKSSFDTILLVSGGVPADGLPAGYSPDELDGLVVTSEAY